MSVGRIAPKGKFRVITVDTFRKIDWVHRECNTQQEAIEVAKERGGKILINHVYDDKGNHIFDSGTFNLKK